MMSRSADSQDALHLETGVARRRAVEALHVFTLCSFAVAQPIFGRLDRRVSFLSDQGIQPAALLLLTGFLLIVPPLLLLAGEVLAGLFGDRWRTRLHRAVIGLLFAAIFLQHIKALCESPSGRWMAVPGAIQVAIAVGVACLLSRASQKPWLQQGLLWSSAGLVIFPVSFLCFSHVAGIVFPKPIDETMVHVENPASVVVVIFDEFCGTSLLDEHHQIDEGRYPNFAALARTATWYRNATTVHARTESAIPALMSGRRPVGSDQWAVGEYPQNLFTLLRATQQYDMTVFEPFTRLCPDDLTREIPDHGGSFGQLSVVLQAVWPVYVQGLVPSDVPLTLPEIPRTWFGLIDTTIDRQQRHELTRHSWGERRDEQVEHFLNCLQPSANPQFYFVHLVLPHYPWSYLPSGRKYVSLDDGVHDDARNCPLGTSGFAGETWGNDELISRHSWQRYLLQVGYVDHVIGQLIERLREVDLFDQSLVVIAGDHGVSFLPNQSRRAPSGTNLADILSVPLFIKYPGQQEGRISDRNVESIDLLPTIAEVLGLDVPEPIDGESFLDETRPQRPRKESHDGDSPIVVEADFPRRIQSAERMHRLFGAGSWERLFQIGPRPELVGQSVSRFTVRNEAPVELEVICGSDAEPYYFEGNVRGAENSETPTILAVAVNDRIEAVTRTYLDDGVKDRWVVLLPESAVSGNRRDVRFYAIGDGDVFRPCVLKATRGKSDS